MLEPTGTEAADVAPGPLTEVPLATTAADNPNDGGNNGIVRAAAILSAGNIASRILGLVREMVKAQLFGTSPLLAAFQAAAYVPISLFDLIIGGMVNSSLVPVFSDYVTSERREELWDVLSMVLSAATVVLLLVIALVELFTPQVAWLVGTLNFQDAELSAVSIHLMRLTTPAVLFLGIASILTGVLYALRRFTLPAFIGAAFNGTIVVVALLWPGEIDALVWGLLLGALLQVLLQLPALRDARIRWRLEWRHPAIRRILILYAPILAGLIVNQVAIMLSYNLAIRTGDRSLNYMNYATTLYQFPIGLVVTALSIATLPTLSRQALGHLEDFKRTLADGLRMVLALILPATTGLFALAVPIMALIFQYGKFTALDTEQTATVLRVYLFGMPFAAVDQMLVFASYARKDTWRPALVGFFSIVVYSITALLLLRPLGLLSLMVADAVKHVVHASVMVWLLRRQLGGLAGYGVVGSGLKSLAAAVASGLAAYAVVSALTKLPLPMDELGGRLLIVITGGAVGVFVFAIAAWILDIQEVRSLFHILQRRVRRMKDGQSRIAR